MMFIDLYNKLIQREPIKDIDIFLKDYQSFEEIPLVSRYSHLDFIKEYIEEKDIQLFLLCFAYFYLNCIKLHANKILPKKELSNFFISITFNDLEDLQEVGYCIPNLFITRKLDALPFLKTCGEQGFLNSYPILETAFIESGIIDAFDFKLTTSSGVIDESFGRIYAILKNDINRLKV